MLPNLAATLQSRRFRWLLIAMVVVPIVCAYAVQAVAIPLVAAGRTGASDFSDVYYPAARDVMLGRDPYSEPCHGYGCLDILGSSSSFQPPAMAWALQPLARLDFHTADVLAVILSNLIVLGTVALSVWAARISDRQLMAVALALVLAWAPTIQAVQNRQPQLLLALLGAGWAAGFARRGSGGVLAGAALGMGAALKLMQAPLLALVVWRRRWAMLAGALVAWALLWALGAPGLLVEYLTRVLPAISAGTGFAHNVALAATVDRILEPSSFWGRDAHISPLVRPVTLALAAAFAIVTAWRVGAPSDDPDDRLLEVAAAVSAGLFTASLLWPIHLILLLPPIISMVAIGVRRRRPGLVAAALLTWLLIGPVYQVFVYLTVFGARYEALIRILAESAIAGQVLLWAAAVIARRRARIRAVAPAPAGATPEPAAS